MTSHQTGVLKSGDRFAYDGSTYLDGDILYAEVLEVIARFPDDVDRVGTAAGGYRVAVYCFDEAMNSPSRAVDNYASDFVDQKCLLLSAAEMRRARRAGWPRTYGRVLEALGDEIWRAELARARGRKRSLLDAVDELRARGWVVAAGVRRGARGELSIVWAAASGRPIQDISLEPLEALAPKRRTAAGLRRK